MKKSEKEELKELYLFLSFLDQYSEKYLKDKIDNYSVSKLHYRKLIQTQRDVGVNINRTERKKYVAKKLLMKIPIEELSLEMIIDVLKEKENQSYSEVLEVSVDMAKRLPRSSEDLNLLKIIFNQRDWRYSAYILLKFAERVLYSKYRNYLVTNGDQILGFKSNLGLAYDYIDYSIL